MERVGVSTRQAREWTSCRTRPKPSPKNQGAGDREQRRPEFMGAAVAEHVAEQARR